MNDTRGKRPFRAEHVGSLLRPQHLLDARQNLEGDQYQTTVGSLNFNELQELENVAIKDAIRLQEDVGLQSITDGEFRRRSWWQDFILELGGISLGMAEDAAWQDPQGHKLSQRVVRIDGKIEWNGGILTDAFKYLISQTDRTPKITLPSPPIAHFYGGRRYIDEAVYPDMDEFWDDLIRAYRSEINALAAAGCEYIQLDECILAILCDPSHQEAQRALGRDPNLLIETYIQAINSTVRDRPTGITVAMHLCRGNNRGHWLADGGYDFVADALFTQIDVDAYFLEYDSPRAGDFSPLRYLPSEKRVVLGLVTTKSPELESIEQLKYRIEDASTHVPIDQLCLSPQCGFASNFMGNPVSIDDQRRKLELVVKVAAEVWG